MQVFEGIIALVADILTSLGVNHTIFYQLAIFLVVYIFLSQVLFKPYFAAFAQRKERTVGNQDKAESLLEDARRLEEAFASRAKEINDQIRAVYEQEKSQSLKTQEREMLAAREQAKATVEANRARIEDEIDRVQKELNVQAPLVSQAIVAQLLGKDLKI